MDGSMPHRPFAHAPRRPALPAQAATAAERPDAQGTYVAPGAPPLSKPAARGERKIIHAKITFQRERLADICTDLGPLMRLHDAEIWPTRTWGPPGRVKFNIIKYLTLEQQGILHIITARTGAGRLIGYCFEALEIDDHYGMRGAINCGIFLQKEYRAGKGLSLRKHPAYRLLRERERMLDEFKAERRRMAVKVWLDFGPVLKHFGYEPDMIQYQKIADVEG